MKQENFYDVVRDQQNILWFKGLPKEAKISVSGQAGPLVSTLSDAGEIGISGNGLGIHPIFEVTLGEQQVFALAERNILISGMNNFRDMGGYPTVSGQYVKWGKLYRSDQLYNATDEGVAQLQELGLKTIIDYRSEDEIGKYPNKFIAQNTQTYVLNPNAHTAELSAQFTSSKENEDIELIKKVVEQKEKGKLVNQYDMVMAQYNNFVTKEESKKAFSKMLKIASEPDTSPIDQHCRGGKDRTGFGSMLLLGVLGVPEQVLIEDYMLTQKNRISRNKVKMDKYKTYTNDPEILGYLLSLIDTKEDFIKTSIKKIVSNYSSIEEYVRIELKISAAEIAQLKVNYLE